MRKKSDSLGVTQPIMVYNPVAPVQMAALREVIKKFNVINDFSKQFLIWLFEKTGRLSQAVSVHIPENYRQYGQMLFKDARMITDMWHLNLILKCMDSFMRLHCFVPTDTKPYWDFQVAVKPGMDHEAAFLSFDPQEITLVDLS